jgi:polyhydroxyalkanoate synthase subunit PhaC
VSKEPGPVQSIHLGRSPGKQAELVAKAVRKATRLAVHLGATAGDPETPPCIEPLPEDT